MCCDILLVNTIHYVRVVETQKSLSRIQRIKNKLRNFGKKKVEKKERKQPPTDAIAHYDVEMIEIEQNGTWEMVNFMLHLNSFLSFSLFRCVSVEVDHGFNLTCFLFSSDSFFFIEFIYFLIKCKGSRAIPLDDYEMKETYDERSETITSQHVACAGEPHAQQLLFGNLTSFALNQQQQQLHQEQQQQSQWPPINEDDDDGEVQASNDTVDWLDEIPMYNGFDINDVLIVPPLKPGIDHNNNEDFTAPNKQNPSFFQFAKKIYGNLRTMVNVERTLDEITKQMALLRFTPC